MKVGYTALLQFPAAVMHADVFGGEDPGCMQMESGPERELACNTADDHFRPDSYLTFNFYTTGIYIAWQLWVEGVGGQFSLASTEFEVVCDER